MALRVMMLAINPPSMPDMHGGQIYHRIYNKAFDELFLRLRGQFGGESILIPTDNNGTIPADEQPIIEYIKILENNS